MNEQEEKLLFEPEDPDPERLKQQDLLGFMDIAENEILPDIESFRPPLIYGIYGRWGSGKTFMMRALQKCFEKKERKCKYKTVWFDPWLYEHVDREQLFLGLLNKIQKEIYPKGRELRNIGMKAAAGALALGRLAVDKVVSTENLEDYYKRASKLIGKNQLEVVDAVEKAHADLEKAIEKALDKAGAETLVLFVDDLDRCLPDRAILLLDQLKNFLYLPRVVTILGIDDEVFSRMLSLHYEYEMQLGKQYLDKIVRKFHRLGRGTIKKLLEMYSSRSKLLKDHPLVVTLLVNIWPSIGDLNPRIVRRLAEKLIRIDEVDDVEGKCTMVSNRVFQDNNVRPSWSVFRGSGTFGPQGDLLVSLCCTIAFSFLYPFPLDLENLDSRLDTFKRNGMTPPLEVLNLMYEGFKEWL